MIAHKSLIVGECIVRFGLVSFDVFLLLGAETAAGVSQLVGLTT
jgi:hypothetical protein